MSESSQSIYPVFRYRDAAAAIEWLQKAFGFERREVHEADDGSVAHAELEYRGNLIMLGTERPEADRFGRTAGGGFVYIAVEDTDAHHDRAKAAGAEVVMELTDTDYRSRDYAARDPEGNLWSFGTYRP